MELKEIEEAVKQTLSEKRFFHSQCVMEMCEFYAKHYQIDCEKAKKVGIAHDIAKEMANEEKLQYITENRIPMDEIEKKSQGLLHAKIGADIAKKQFGFDQEMVCAIEAHTTGKPKMSLLSKILFLADATGKDRKWDNIEIIKELALQDINKAVCYLLNSIIEERIEKEKVIHPDTIFTRNEILLEEK